MSFISAKSLALHSCLDVMPGSWQPKGCRSPGCILTWAGINLKFKGLDGFK